MMPMLIAHGAKVHKQTTTEWLNECANRVSKCKKLIKLTRARSWNQPQMPHKSSTCKSTPDDELNCTLIQFRAISFLLKWNWATKIRQRNASFSLSSGKHSKLEWWYRMWNARRCDFYDFKCHIWKKTTFHRWFVAAICFLSFFLSPFKCIYAFTIHQPFFSRQKIGYKTAL